MAKPTKKNQVAPLATPSKWSTNRWYHVIVFLFSFLLYVNSISNDYNLDDELVTRNHRLTSKGISAIPEIFSSPYYQDASGYSYEYRPIVLASFAIEHSLFGESAFVSHFINVLLYALVCLLLFVVLKKLLSTYPAIVPFAITILFAAHTAHTEVVCSIKNRDELLGLGFGLLALLASFYATKGKKLFSFLFIPLCYSLALLSKPTFIVFSVLIPLVTLFSISVKIRDFFIVFISMIVPSYIIINNLTGIMKLEIVLAISLLNLLLFLLFRYNDIKQWLVKIPFKSAKWIHLKQLFETTNDSSETKDVLGNIIPDKAVFNPFYLLLNICLGFLYVLAIYHSYSLIAVAPLAGLVFIAWFGQKNLSWSANTILILCAVSNPIFLSNSIEKSDFYLKYYNSVSIFLAFTLFWRERSLVIPSLIGLCLIALQYKTFSVAEIAIILLFAYLIRFRIVTILIAALSTAIVSYDFVFNHSIIEWHKFIGFVLLWGTYTKRTIAATWFALIIAFAYFHFTSYTLDNDFSQLTKEYFDSGYSYVLQTADRKSPILPTTKENRTIHFVENCVTKSDDWSTRIGTSMQILVHYLHKTILPYPLSFYYGYSFISPQQIYNPISIVGLVLYSFLLLLILVNFRTKNLIGLGIFIFLIAIAVFSNIFIQVPGMIGDRYLMLPSLGLSITIVGIIYWLLSRNKNTFPESYKEISPIYKLIFSGLVCLYSVLTVARNNDWKDDLTLFRKDINYVSESAQAHNLLALHLMMHSEVETNPTTAMAMTQEALVHFKKAKQIYPKFFNASYDIGRVYIKLNMIDSALIAFKDATTIDSTYATVYNYIGEIYFSKQMYNEAVPYYEKVVELDPLNYDNYNKLSYDYFMLQEYDKSVEVCKKALAAIPSEPQPLINMGRMFLLQNKTDSALYYLNIAKTKVPNNPELNSLLQQVKQ